MRRGVDYSWGRPGAAAVRAAGFQFVMRYCPFPGDFISGKGLRPDELAELHGEGLAVGIVFESSERRPLDGFGAGQADANAAKWAFDYLGWPADRPMFFAVDFDPKESELEAIEMYFSGLGSVLRVERVGAYGGTRTLRFLKNAGLISWSWQSLAWNSGEVPGRHLYQSKDGEHVNGAEVDWDEAYGDDSGLWEADAVTRAEYEALVKRVEDLELYGASGQEEGELERASRLEKASYRIKGVVEGPQEKAQQDRSLAQQIANIAPARHSHVIKAAASAAGIVIPNRTEES